jgi:hypothetical protein
MTKPRKEPLEPTATDESAPQPENTPKPMARTDEPWAGEHKDSFAGRPDQDVKNTLGPGAGGATEWGGGNKNHPSRIRSRPPGG